MDLADDQSVNMFDLVKVRSARRLTFTASMNPRHRLVHFFSTQRTHEYNLKLLIWGNTLVKSMTMQVFDSE